MHLLLTEYFYVPANVVIFQIIVPHRNPERIFEREIVYRDIPDFMNKKTRDLSEFFRYIGDVWKSIQDGIALEAGVSHEAPYCFAQRFRRDIHRLREIRSYYECPFIYLINSGGYPCLRFYSFAVDEMKNELLRSGDEICLTDFGCDDFIYRMHAKDGHPNKLRARLTAYKLLPIVGRLLQASGDD
jgi:hypothetical protein